MSTFAIVILCVVGVLLALVLLATIFVICFGNVDTRRRFGDHVSESFESIDSFDFDFDGGDD